METITKKQFNQILCNNATAQIFVTLTAKEDKTASLLEKANNNLNQIKDNAEFRTVIKQRSNGVIFSNNSVLDYPSGANYMQDGQIIAYCRPWVDNFDGSTRYEINIYLIKE